MKIKISDLDKSAVLAALFNSARPKGTLGLMLWQGDPSPMTKEQAKELIREKIRLALCGRVDPIPEISDESVKKLVDDYHIELFFDYHKGRPLKVKLEGDEFNSRLYDSFNGYKRAEVVIEKLRCTGSIDDYFPLEPDGVALRALAPPETFSSEEDDEEKPRFGPR